MAKTAASDVWHTAIKEIGNGWITFIARTADIGATTYWVGQAMEIGNDGELLIFTTAQPDYNTGVTVAEPIVDDDRYFLAKKKGAEILHNQKLAGAYVIGDCVYQTAAGTWTITDESTAASLLVDPAFVVGPVDRITGGVLKGIDDAFAATEPVDILI
jgi:hypothetical protein